MTPTDGRPAPGRPPWYPPAAPLEGFRPVPAEAVEGSIGDRLRVVADEHGDRVALRGPAGERTYHELVDTAVGRARTLRQRLGASDDRPAVAIAAEHDVGLVEALLAVLSAGHPALVLDPFAPEALNASLLADSRAALVLADAAHLDLAGALGGSAEVVPLHGLEVASGPPPAVAPGAAALLAYTSGTSGDAKAAVVPHHQILHLIRGAAEVLAIRPVDRLPMLFPLSLAVASYPALLPLLTGGSLTTFDVRGQGFAGLPAWLADEAVTVAYLAPTVVRFLEGATGDVAFPDLRQVVLGGERVDQAAVDLTHELFGDHVQVVNGYGTTETGVLTFWFTGDDDVDRSDGEATIPAGHAIPGMELRIVGDEARPLATGEVGELVVCSDHLFAGYRGRPELDALVLSTDAATGRAVYRTGDLGRLDDDGALRLVGRVDTQVKVRGRRVVLGEVEDALLQLEVVDDAVVVAGRDAAGHTTIVAHLVVDDGVTTDRVRAELAERVPAQMVPAAFVLHDALPQLPNGKLDRHALVGSGGGARPVLSTPYVAPETAVEVALVELWEELLDVAPIGADDDFFDLGGNSLLASRMLVELEDRLGHRVPMAALLDGATARSLAVAVADHESGRRRPSGLVTIQEGDPGRPVLYLTHDLHGSAFRFRHLARALGTDQPVRGFESPALTGDPFPFSRIETLALRYVTELQRAQPEGPYHLCGYSFGGIVAFEMARHLRAAGEEVALLAVVDIGPGYRGLDYGRTRPPRGPWLDLPAPAEPGAPWRRRAGRFGAAVRQSPRDIVSYAVFNSRFRRRLLPVGWWWQLRRHGKIRPRHRLWYAYQVHWGLVGPSWQGAPYEGEVTLFWADDTASADATMGWGALGATVEVHRIPVSHERIMDEAEVHHLAAPLRAAIDRTTTRAGGRTA
jgi:amino acid adenylation domain-containing protein